MAAYTRIVLEFTLFGAVLRWEDGTAKPPTAELSLADLASLRQAIDSRLELAGESHPDSLPRDAILGGPGSYHASAYALGF